MICNPQALLETVAFMLELTDRVPDMHRADEHRLETQWEDLYIDMNLWIWKTSHLTILLQVAEMTGAKVDQLRSLIDSNK